MFGAGVDRFALQAPGCRRGTEQRAALGAATTRNTDRGWCAMEADVIEILCRCRAELRLRRAMEGASEESARRILMRAVDLVGSQLSGARGRDMTGRGDVRRAHARRPTGVVSAAHPPAVPAAGRARGVSTGLVAIAGPLAASG
jgi:hypothetical protein